MCTLAAWQPLLDPVYCIVQYMCTCVQGGVLLCTLAAWQPLLDPVYCIVQYMCTCVQGGVLLCTLAAWLPLLDPVASSILKDMERPGTDSSFVFTELSFRFSYQFVDQFSNLISNQ